MKAFYLTAVLVSVGVHGQAESDANLSERHAIDLQLSFKVYAERFMLHVNHQQLDEVCTLPLALHLFAVSTPPANRP
jgi:hypothetical protein